MATTAAKKATVVASAVICRATIEVRRAGIEPAPLSRAPGLQPGALPFGHRRKEAREAPSRRARYSLRWVEVDTMESVRHDERDVKQRLRAPSDSNRRPFGSLRRMLWTRLS
jgi:hypothetical protein